MWKLNLSPNILENSTPLTLLPNSSKFGDQTHMPITFGITIIIAPETPDFAGKPILKAYSPEKSYIPQEFINDKQFLTVEELKTFLPVSGFTPPFAKVAAALAIDGDLTSIEQHWK